MAAKVNKGHVVSVVAGGWSVSRVDHCKIPGDIIAINDSALLLDLPQYRIEAVSMDRLWVEHRWPELKRRKMHCHLRQAAVKNIALEELHAARPRCNVFVCNHESVEFTGMTNVLNGTNSAVCGLALAYAIAPEVLYLFGFDMCKGPNGEAHWYPDYPWQQGGGTSPGKFNAWAMEFNKIAQQFKSLGTEVINVTDRSLLNCFPKSKPETLGMSR